jgi:DNA-binding CsgD family transcriptional regulator
VEKEMTMARPLPVNAETDRGTSTKAHRSESTGKRQATMLRVVEEEERPQLPSESTLDSIASVASAAFAIDRDDRIVYWNTGAEKMLGKSYEDVRGHACYEVLKGCDPFGNRYCGPHCPITSAATAGIEPEPFLMDVKSGDTGVKVRVRTVAYPENGPQLTALVHLLEPGKELEKMLVDLRAFAGGQAPAAEPEAETVPNPLTAREREILLMLSNGYAALNIAARLNLSHATVRNHIQNILRKLEVHGQVEAIALAFRRGWV